MPIYFSVDRNKTLQKGTEIALIQHNDISPVELQNYINTLFPDGVTNHGERYMLQPCPANQVNSVIELIFEYERRNNFISCPSRMQSVFAFDNLESAKKFREIYGNNQGAIVKIDAISAFKADMNLLTLKDSLLQLSYNAHKYWKGEASDSPFWEHLLIPPVKVIDIIKDE
ncbi:MAG: DUF2441 domain-containing protein [Parcubacteria group bacterium]|nr:MAG: DUF2441 domain-containing protein [Parcubacteria group bacterium]